MANEYPKIQTLFLRDENSIIIPDKFTCPEFEWLKNCLWECTEKIDGTNIHIDHRYVKGDDAIEMGEDNDMGCVLHDMDICGRTERAQIPKNLPRKLSQLFSCEDDWDEMDDNCPTGRWYNAFGETIQKYLESDDRELRISVYGEGYGKSIQKDGSSYISHDTGFILFDVKVNDWWLSREACEEIAQKLEVPIVPLIGYMTIPEAIEYVKKGFKSTIAENPYYDAEGLVLKTPNGLQYRNGQRIITKIKTCDFRKYQQRYGDGPVEQTPNTHYNK